MKWIASLAVVTALIATPYVWANCGGCGGDKKAETKEKAPSSCAKTTAAKCPTECAATAFKHMDANGDGKVCQAEFTAAMPKLVATAQAGGCSQSACAATAKATGGCPKAATKARMTHLVASFDANKNGRLCKAELTEARSVMIAVLKASGSSAKAGSGCCPSAAKAKNTSSPELKEVSIEDLTAQAIKVMDGQKAASADDKTNQPVKVTRAE